MNSKPLALRICAHARLEVLAEDLSKTLTSAPLADPFAPEWLILPHGGMQTWLTGFLAERIGIWSHAQIGLPADLLWDLAQRVLPEPSPPRLDYNECLWLLLAQVDTLLAEPALALMQGWVERYGGASARLQLVQVLAEQLELLGLYRPELLRVWSKAPAPSWAAVVWHFLCQLTGAGDLHRAALQAEILKRLNQAPPLSPQGCREASGRLVGRWPERLTLFAVDDLPPFYLDLLGALARHIPTTLYLTQPMHVPRLDLETVAQGLWLGCGEMYRSQLHLLQERGWTVQRLPLHPESSPDTLPDSESPQTLLQALQATLQKPDTLHLPMASAVLGDQHSVQIHVTHGPLRELEVLHNYLLGTFEALPDLLPGDIAVLVPDLETYAPLIEGVFYRPVGSAERLPFRIVPPDHMRSPELLALRSLFELSGSRLSRDEVMAFLEQGPVARRFGFDADALAQISLWLEAVEIRWGLDAEHREHLNLPRFEENSWHQGLKRLLLGFALHDEGQAPFAGLLPYPAMEGNAVQLLGQLLDFFQSLEQAYRLLNTAQAPERWAQLLPHLAESLLRPPSEGIDDWHLLLAQMADLHKLAGKTPETLSLGQVRSALEKAWNEPRFRDIPPGLITFATPAQLQGVPYPVICFLGLNSGVLPRAERPHELDLLAESPRKGDPSLRQRDRHLFLQTLLSARERLYLSYTGRRVRDNLELPPSVLISELQDAVQTLRAAPLPVLVHPLHPFAAGYFQASPSPARSWSQRAFEEAQALQAPRQSQPFISGPLPPLSAPDAPATLNWQALLAFFKQPARAFLKQRLGLSLGLSHGQNTPPVQNERFQLNALEIWQLREDYLDWCLQGLPSADFFERLRASHHLPLGLAGARICTQIQTEVDPLARQLQRLTGAPLPALGFELPLGRWTLQGELTPLFERGVIITRLSGLKAADRLQIWLYHLLLGALGQSRSVAQIGLSKGQAQHLSYAPVPEPAYLLTQYLQLYEQGLQSPLPVALESAWAWFSARDKGPEKAQAAAESSWWGGHAFGGESEKAEYALCLPPDWIQSPACAETALKLYLPLEAYLQEKPLGTLV
ncbi:MAG: exodeoxyribonuclease V subunit gamma [Candidatus Sericytochromatia bacterium]